MRGLKAKSENIMLYKDIFINPPAIAAMLVGAAAVVTVNHYTNQELTYAPTYLNDAQLPNIYQVEKVQLDDESGKASVIMNGFRISVEFDFSVENQMTTMGPVPNIDITSLTVGSITAANTGHQFNDFTTHQERSEIAAEIKAFVLKNGLVEVSL